MTGETIVLDDRAWLDALKLKAAERRVPIAGMLELTSRCNLKCQHCYLGPQAEQHKKRALEMSTDEVKGVIDQLVSEGCLSLTITGGDPMMRKDFAEVYRYAREQGLLVTVFCDAILVTDKILALFAEYPPRRIEVSIYGATAETYETVTRVKGSFAKAVAGIHRLIDLGVVLELKTVLMTLNQHELDAMRAMAAELGVSFRFDAAIFPCLPDNSVEPLDLRVAPEEVVREEMADPKMREMWARKLERSQQQDASSSMYSCAAGGSALYVDPQGQLSPCLMTTHHRFDLKKNSLKNVWNNEIKTFREKQRSCNSNSALAGPLRGLCSHCPAFNYLENGDEEVDSAYALKLAELRSDYLSKAPVKD